MIIATIETIFTLRISIVGSTLFYKLFADNAMLCSSKAIQNNTTNMIVVSIKNNC